MGFYKKTILLKNNNSNMGMGLLTIERTGSGVFATLKSYEINETANMVLGIALNGASVAKQNIVFSNGDSYTFKLPNDFDIDGKIGAVLVDKGRVVTPLVWGSNNGKSTYKEDIVKMFKEDNHSAGTTKPLQTNTRQVVQHQSVTEISAPEIGGKTLSEENTIEIDNQTLAGKEAVDTYKQILSGKELEDIEKHAMSGKEAVDIDKYTSSVKKSFNIDKQMSSVKKFEEIVDDDAKHNAYLYENTPEEIEQLIDENMDSDSDFYSLIKDQIDDLFERFPRNARLEALVDNSKWVDIDYEGDGKAYVVGLLYDENGTLEYIAYGVPSTSDIRPPRQIADYSQWLPLDQDQPDGDGYWVMFQNAQTGDSVRLKAE